MILEQNVREIERSSNFEETSFKIEASAAVMKLLRSSIYSNPILSVIRESATNGVDAHVFAGKELTPISITLPSYLEPTFKVRDFGDSMNHETVMDLYATYGRSTKGGSNNFIGAMGIGKFSPFSYVPCFQLTCVQNNFKRVYQMYLDESDKGKIALLFEEKCEEENGTEVSLGVQSKDIPQFIREAQHLFRFWKVKPIVSGNTAYKNEVPEYLLGRDDSWGFRKVERNANSVSYIVMGGIPYSFNSSYVPNAPEVHKLLLDKNLVLFANIGDIDIAASRETAQVTNKTTKFITEKLANIENEVRSEIENKLSAAITEYEARKLYYQVFNGQGGLNVVKNLIGSIGIMWAGQKIENYCFEREFESFEVYFSSESSWRRSAKRRVKVTENNGMLFDLFAVETFSATKKVPVAFYDLKNKGTGKLRKMGKFYLEQNGFVDKEALTILSIKNLSDLETYCNDKGIDSKFFQNIDDVIKLPAPVRLGSSSAMPKGFNAQVYDCDDILDDKPDYEIDNDSGVTFELANVEDFGAPKYYVIREGKNYEFSCGTDIDFSATYKMLKEIDPEFAAHPVIYIFTKRYAEKLIGWKSIESVVKEKVLALWDTLTDGFYYGDVLTSNYHNYALTLSTLIGLKKITSKPVLAFLTQISFTRIHAPHSAYMHNSFRISHKPKNFGGLSDEFNALLERAPLLKLIEMKNWHDDKVVSYINYQIN